MASKDVVIEAADSSDVASSLAVISPASISGETRGVTTVVREGDGVAELDTDWAGMALGIENCDDADGDTEKLSVRVGEGLGDDERLDSGD